ncbi:MAG: response regulator [Spartobacteria bacterium]|nr:response regulator [Spartobacteria bacterium]
MARILLVDDEEEMVYNLSALLRHEGYQVEAVCDGLEAMNRLQSTAIYDVLVSDLNMAPVDGMEVVRTARAERPELEIIVVSGELVDGENDELRELGCRVQISKPFNAEDVLLAVRQVTS